jgi:hypothetical protein
MFSGTTISYHRVSISSEDVSDSIFQLHLESLIKILQLLSSLLFLFFGLTFCIDVYYFFIGDTLDMTDSLMLLFKEIVNMLGILTGIFCLTAVRLKSRGSSLKFTRILTVFCQIYVIYLLSEIVVNYPEIMKSSNIGNHASLVYLIVCFFLILIFFMKFFVGKARQYNSIITQAILDNTKRMLEGIDAPVNIGFR